MSYLDESLGIPLDELPRAYLKSLRDLLHERGCPAIRLDEATEKAYYFGWRLMGMASGDELVTKRFYAEMVEAAVSQTMDDEKMTS